MIQTVRKAWGIPELRKKIVFTLLILLIFRLGNAIMVPYINRDALALQMQVWGTGLLGLYNVMSGGAFATATVFALSIQPYINSSIIIQLLTVAIPALERLARDGGEEGKKKIQSITRYATVAIAILQAIGYYFMMKNYNLLEQDGIWVALVIIVTLIAGSSFVMWMGEQVTEFGVGNGISIILFAGILARIPSMVSGMKDGIQRWSAINAGTLTAETLTSAGYTEAQAQAYLNGALAPWSIALLVIGMLALIAFIVFINDAERRIPVQYAKRVMGNKMFNGATQYLPLKLNYSGVMPVIFATAILSLPQVLFSQIAHYNTTLQWIATKMNDWLNPASSGYYIISGLMIFFFSYFWVATMFQPSQIAEDLKRNGGYIPGIRPGPPTALFLDQTMQRLTFAGSAFLTLIYFLPSLLNIGGNIPYLVTQFFGGTSLLILVGVLLDMMRQVETTLLSRNYDGFLKKGKLKGKYGHIQGTGAAAGSRTVTVMWIVIALLVLAGAIAYNAMQ